jgi:hypothetical protein
MDTAYNIVSYLWWVGFIHWGILMLWRPKFPDTFSGGVDGLITYTSFILWWVLAFGLFWTTRIYEFYKCGW